MNLDSGIQLTTSDGDDYAEFITNERTINGFAQSVRSSIAVGVAIKNHRGGLKNYYSCSISDAVKIKDWLSDIINRANEAGYFNQPKEMTLAQVQLALGHKVKIVE